MKKMIYVLLVVCSLMVLCACGSNISREEAIGTWSGAYEYDGNNFAIAFELKSDGNYSEVVYKNGSFSEINTGTWEVKDGDVYTYETGGKYEWDYVKYDFKGDALVNGGHKFYKK